MQAKVENFGFVNSLHVDKMNEHLEYMLDAFDREYMNFGQLGSATHAMDKLKFARSASISIIESIDINSGNITALATNTKVYLSSIAVEINVQNATTWGDKTPLKYYNEVFPSHEF